jgi:hypothetical protein
MWFLPFLHAESLRFLKIRLLIWEAGHGERRLDMERRRRSHSAPPRLESKVDRIRPPPLFEFLVIYNIINDGGSIFQSRNMSPFNLSFQSPLLPVEISADAFFTSSFTYPEGESVQVNTNYKACIFSLPHLTCTHLEFKLLIINELLSAQCFTICYFNSKLLPHFCQPVIPVEMSDDPQSSLEEK